MKISKYILIAALALTGFAPALYAAEAQAPGVEISVADTPKIKVVSGHVEIDIPGSNSHHVDIYALTGQIVKQFDAQPGSNIVELPAGYYIVRIDRISVKIVVK